MINQHDLLLNQHYRKMKNKLGKMITHACKIHIVEEEAFGGGTKGGVEKNQEMESEAHSIS